MELIYIDIATLEDIEEIYRIEKSSFKTPWTRELIREELTFPLSLNLVAKYKDRVCGFLLSWQIPPEIHILTLAVEPESRGIGIGRALMEGLFAEAERRNCYKFTLEVRASNKDAIEFYKRFNFIPKGVRKRYYQDTNEDAIIMWRERSDEEK